MKAHELLGISKEMVEDVLKADRNKSYYSQWIDIPKPLYGVRWPEIKVDNWLGIKMETKLTTPGAAVDYVLKDAANRVSYVSGRETLVVRARFGGPDVLGSTKVLKFLQVKGAMDSEDDWEDLGGDDLFWDATEFTIVSHAGTEVALARARERIAGETCFGDEPLKTYQDALIEHLKTIFVLKDEQPGMIFKKFEPGERE